MSDFNELFSSFTEHMKVKNYAPPTRDSYGRGLRTFLAHLTELGITDVKRVTRDILYDYQAKLMTEKTSRKLSYSFVSAKIRAIKRFFEQLEASGALLLNPAEYIKEPKKETRLPRTVLTEDEVRSILDQPDLSTITGLRDRAVLEVFYSTGIRLEEMVSLTIFDCDLQGGLLRVNNGKGSKDRVVPLGKHAVRFLKEYITRVRPQLTQHDKTEKHLFMSRQQSPMSIQVAEIMARNHARKAGVKKRVTPHVFRHTFATELIRNGADICAVQKMLGHSDLKTTTIYTHVAGCDVKKTHSTSHPREKDNETTETITPDLRGIKLERQT
jgi:integrase/recombinase XerD